MTEKIENLLLNRYLGERSINNWSWSQLSKLKKQKMVEEKPMVSISVSIWMDWMLQDGGEANDTYL